MMLLLLFFKDAWLQNGWTLVVNAFCAEYYYLVVYTFIKESSFINLIFFLLYEIIIVLYY